MIILKKRKILLGSIFVIILIIIIICLFLNYKSTNKTKLESIKSLITLQSEYEKDITTKGYTFDNPKVILDPYKSSPLTALILFETDNEVIPKITVKGKDKNTTITHEFK